MKHVTMLGTLLIVISVVSFQFTESNGPPSRFLRRTLDDRNAETNAIQSSTLPLDIADVDSELQYNITQSNDDFHLTSGNDDRFEVHQDDNNDDGMEAHEDGNIDDYIGLDYTADDDGRDFEHSHDGELQLADYQRDIIMQDDLAHEEANNVGYTALQHTVIFNDTPEEDSHEVTLDESIVGNNKDMLRDRTSQAKKIAMKDLKTAYVPSTKYIHQPHSQPKTEPNSLSCE